MVWTDGDNYDSRIWLSKLRRRPLRATPRLDAYRPTPEVGIDRRPSNWSVWRGRPKRQLRPASCARATRARGREFADAAIWDLVRL